MTKIYSDFIYLFKIVKTCQIDLNHNVILHQYNPIPTLQFLQTPLNAFLRQSFDAIYFTLQFYDMTQINK
jgi:hypothetical protein